MSPAPELPCAPESYALRTGEAHVWRVRLASTLGETGEMRALLSDAERGRGERFAFERDQARFISCRAALRVLLGRYTGIAPKRVHFRYGTHGKPALDGAEGWEFSVSHSGELAAIAVSRGNAIGVDLEWVDPAFPHDEVGPDVFCAEELRELAARPAEEQAARFFQLWTLKEALLKAAGCGLGMDPCAIRIRLEEAAAVVYGPADFSGASLRSFTLQEGYASACAMLGSVTGLAFFSAQPFGGQSAKQ